jgi:hypothetical protein
MNWQFIAPDGSFILDELLFRGDFGPTTLAQSGTYTITVGGEEGEDETGTYQFQLTVP